MGYVIRNMQEKLQNVFFILCSLNKPFLSFSGPILEEQKLLILQREIDFHVRRFDTFDKEKHENQTGQGNLLRGIDNSSGAKRSVLHVH